MNIDNLKKVIQQANPEIMEPDNLVSELLTYLPDERGRYKWVWDECTNEEQKAVKAIRGKIEVPRPIRLADVLLAMGSKKYMISNDGHTNYAELTIDYWNLKDDNLDNQSDECKEFLINLLSPK